MVVNHYLIFMILRLPWGPILLLNFPAKQTRTFIRSRAFLGFEQNGTSLINMIVLLLQFRKYFQVEALFYLNVLATENTCDSKEK